MRLPSVVYMTEHFALKVDPHGYSLRRGDVRDIVHIVQHSPILVDCVQGALHQLAALKEEVNVVSEYLLPVTIALDLEHELTACHPICNLECLVQEILFSIHHVETQCESFLFQIFFKFVLKVCNVSILSF